MENIPVPSPWKARFKWRCRINCPDRVRVEMPKWKISISGTIVSNAFPHPQIPQLKSTVRASTETKEVSIILTESDSSDSIFVSSYLQSHLFLEVSPCVVQHQTVISVSNNHIVATFIRPYTRGTTIHALISSPMEKYQGINLISRS
jgi:hypothetical protein